MQKYATIEKRIGETPLEALERLRADLNLSTDIPMAYAGRLDPMASGKLLVLVGEECKNQENYHKLDKVYEFEVLFGVTSDTQDVLGRLDWAKPISPTLKQLTEITKSLIGSIALPYPHFSSKTVQGKPLHVWTLEGRLGEITIPTNESEVYRLDCLSSMELGTSEIFDHVIKKINTITPVTAESKALGADFRRVDVKADWKKWQDSFPNQTWTVAKFICVASSGTYMRSLSALIGQKSNTKALAFSIHRTKMGHYRKMPMIGGIWTKSY